MLSFVCIVWENMIANIYGLPFFKRIIQVAVEMLFGGMFLQSFTVNVLLNLSMMEILLVFIWESIIDFYRTILKSMGCLNCICAEEGLSGGGSRKNR